MKAYAKPSRCTFFRTYQGEDASGQPADLADVFPHETAASWTRTYLREHPFDRNGSLHEQERRFTAALAACGRKANAEYDVAGLCSRLPDLWRKSVARGGDRLSR